MTAQEVIQACKNNWGANSGNCSAFVRAVAASLGVNTFASGDDADAIMDRVAADAGWSALADGAAAAAEAANGSFVIAGLKGGDLESPSPHGHVVVVVDGPLAQGAYPTAFWGSLNGTGEQEKTLNWAWKKADRDNVKYFAHS